MCSIESLKECIGVPSRETECILFKECWTLLNESVCLKRLLWWTRFTMNYLCQRNMHVLKQCFMYKLYVLKGIAYRLKGCCIWNMPCMLQVQFTTYVLSSMHNVLLSDPSMCSSFLKATVVCIYFLLVKRMPSRYCLFGKCIFGMQVSVERICSCRVELLLQNNATMKEL